jgi:Flp pilus assembly protein TadG
MRQTPQPPERSEEGAVVVFVALAMVVLLGMAALAIDVGYLHVVRGELQNAADSGALAGAQVLYVNNGQLVNAGANAVAQNYVTLNFSEQGAVTVQSIQRGHWSFTAQTFTPNNSLLPVDLWNQTTAQLDANVNFINAVRVRTTRTTVNGQLPTPFFAGILGITGSPVSASAVAYIGFAGNATPHEFDQPIGICRQSLLDANGAYTCSVGRMISSGASVAETGGWTNFSQPCSTANPGSISPYVCATGNNAIVTLGAGMGTTNGQVQNVYDDLRTCWMNRGLDTVLRDGTPGQDGWPDRQWSITLPVIDCPGNAVSNCSRVVGAVEVNVVWITRNDKTNFNEVPRVFQRANGTMWYCSVPSAVRNLSRAQGQQCWDEFRTAFNLQDSGASASYEDKTLYFLPDCTPHVPAGTTGGENYGILAKIPVLVQ